MNVQTPRAFANATVPTGDQSLPLPPAQKSKIELLLDNEAAMRNVADAAELSYLVVNEWRPIIHAAQIYLMERNKAGVLRVSFASDVTKVDPRSPLCVTLADAALQKLEGKAVNEWHEHYLDQIILESGSFPYRHGFTAKIAYKNDSANRYIFALSAVPFSEGDRVIASRLGATVAHAFWAMSPKGKRSYRPSNITRWALGISLGVVLLGFLPVPLSILAPLEIVAKNPFLASAPQSGVIETIDVEPNSTVSAGTVLFHMNDTELRATLDIAQKSVAVAEARLRRAQQGASASADLRREVGIAQAELALSAAERNGALARLERTIVRAPIDGVVMFNRKEDWIGRPVSTGERILEIANPKDVEASIEVGLHDSIVLNNPKAVTLFLDSNPLNPVTAIFKSAGYQSQFARNEQLAFPVRATIEADGRQLRIGQRGTAQIRAQKVSLAFFLFRRPLAGLRQKVGL